MNPLDKFREEAERITMHAYDDGRLDANIDVLYWDHSYTDTLVSAFKQSVLDLMDEATHDYKAVTNSTNLEAKPKWMKLVDPAEIRQKLEEVSKDE